MATRVRPPARLPAGATLDPAEAEVLVQDPVRAGTAHTYWTARFRDLGEEDAWRGDEAWTSPAARFVRALDPRPLAEQLPGRSHLFREGVPRERGGDGGLLVRDAGCLLSLADVAAEVGAPDAAAVLAHLRAFTGAARGEAPPGPLAVSPAGQGVRAARELYDVLRRLRWAGVHAERFGVDRTELLALHRQEGAFAVAPPRDSYAHGPLVNTRAGRDCRTSRVITQEAGIERPGFVLVAPYSETMRRRGVPHTPVAFSVELVLRDLLFVGGLDLLVLFQAEGREHDELVLLMRAALRDPPSPPVERFARAFPTPGISPAQQASLYWILFANLVMAHLEASDPLPPAAAALHAAFAELEELADAHAAETRSRGGTLDLHHLDDDAGTGTELCLRAQARWYASRRQPATLLAVGDRTPEAAALPRFPPFVTYLRFHTGDPIFGGVLLRLLRALPTLAEAWRARGLGRVKWGAPLLDALKRSKWPGLDRKEQKARLERWRADESHWRKFVNVSGPPAHRETRWRHLGLLDALRRAGSPPPWLPRAEVPTVGEPAAHHARLVESAAVMRRTLEALTALELHETVGLALEFTPVELLVEAGVFLPPPRRAEEVPRAFRPELAPPARLRAWRLVEARAPLLKAHGFERLRLSYAAAWEGSVP